MWIGYDITECAFRPKGGISRYQRRLLAAIMKLAPEHRYTAFVVWPRGKAPAEARELVAREFPAAEAVFLRGGFVPHVLSETHAAGAGLARALSVSTPRPDGVQGVGTASSVSPLAQDSPIPRLSAGPDVFHHRLPRQLPVHAQLRDRSDVIPRASRGPSH
jgi:hypothetical protein